MKPKENHNQFRLGSAKDYANAAYADYIAARTLIRHNMLQQGTRMAAESVEKYLKAAVAFRGNSVSGHLTHALVRNVHNFAPNLFKQVREDFVWLLEKAYRMRYYDNLEVGFNIVLPQLKILAELDAFAFLSEEAFDYRENGVPVKSSFFYADLKNGDDHLAGDNFVLAEIAKGNKLIPAHAKRDFVCRPQLVVDLRVIATDAGPEGQVVPGKKRLELRYVSPGVVTETSFMIAGFLPTSDDGKQFKLAYLGPPTTEVNPVKLVSVSPDSGAD